VLAIALSVPAKSAVNIPLRPLSIGAMSPFPSTSGGAHPQKFAARGTTPMSWTVRSGTLPTEVALVSATDVLGGTPKAVAVSPFMVTATNPEVNNLESLPCRPCRLQRPGRTIRGPSLPT
jgi:hypothetical protein